MGIHGRLPMLIISETPSRTRSPAARPRAFAFLRVLSFGAHRRPVRQPRGHRTGGRDRLKPSQSAARNRHCPWELRGGWGWGRLRPGPGGSGERVRSRVSNGTPPHPHPGMSPSNSHHKNFSPTHSVALSLSLSKSFPAALSSFNALALSPPPPPPPPSSPPPRPRPCALPLACVGSSAPRFQPRAQASSSLDSHPGSAMCRPQ